MKNHFLRALRKEFADKGKVGPLLRRESHQNLHKSGSERQVCTDVVANLFEALFEALLKDC